jgi:hypothetical protein
MKCAWCLLDSSFLEWWNRSQETVHFAVASVQDSAVRLLQRFMVHNPQINRVNYDNHVNSNYCQLHMLELHLTEPNTRVDEQLGHF